MHPWNLEKLEPRPDRPDKKAAEDMYARTHAWIGKPRLGHSSRIKLGYYKPSKEGTCTG